MKSTAGSLRPLVGCVVLLVSVYSEAHNVESTRRTTSTTGDTPESVTEWMFNTTESAEIIRETDGTPVLVNVQAAEIVTIDKVDFVLVEATGMPNYQSSMTQTDIDTLNNRPNAMTDFVLGATTATVGSETGGSRWRRQRWAGTCVLACREKPLTLAQRVSVRVGLSPSYSKLEPMRRTF